MEKIVQLNLKTFEMNMLLSYSVLASSYNQSTTIMAREELYDTWIHIIDRLRKTEIISVLCKTEIVTVMCKDRSHKTCQNSIWTPHARSHQMEYIPVDLQPSHNVHNVGLVAFRTPYSSPCASEWVSQILTNGNSDQTEISNLHNKVIKLAEDKSHALPTINSLGRAD